MVAINQFFLSLVTTFFLSSHNNQFFVVTKGLVAPGNKQFA